MVWSWNAADAQSHPEASYNFEAISMSAVSGLSSETG